MLARTRRQRVAGHDPFKLRHLLPIYLDMDRESQRKGGTLRSSSHFLTGSGFGNLSFSACHFFTSSGLLVSV